MSIVRSYTEDSEIISEYHCNPKKIIHRQNDSPITEIDECILKALCDVNDDMSRVSIEDDDGKCWSLV